MLDTIFIIVFLMGVVFYAVDFGYRQSERMWIVGILFIFLGFSLFSTGFQSSNSAVGTYQIIGDPSNNTDANISFSPTTFLGSPTQSEDPNFDLGVTTMASVLVLFGFGMVLHNKEEIQRMGG